MLLGLSIQLNTAVMLGLIKMFCNRKEIALKHFFTWICMTIIYQAFFEQFSFLYYYVAVNRIKVLKLKC